MRFKDYFFSYLRLPLLLRIFSIIGPLIILFGIIIHFIEPTNFPTIFEGIYWAVITGATVGFGDFVPKTAYGRMMSILLVFMGSAFIGFFTVNVAAAIIQKQNKYKEGNFMFKGREHLIIVGWNERSKQTISELLHQPQPPYKHIVLIDETLKENPMYQQELLFINGSPVQDDTWAQANVKTASTVLITADQNLKESAADMQTILAVLTVRGVHPDVVILAEILTAEQKQNGYRAGADDLITTTVIASNVMVNRLHDLQKRN
ncbi:Ion transport 2 domain-containing protein [Fictibacillus macauensis ZFHKF-1]|uniref:Ion transport 2 domain-containing protein n=1 Tax=Fictibacillus macauensis ZFHKF-1 TaxID=1196324 RepID=I8J1J7_9BACL|nr:potassium channel family protein [Fictibacillus macauensis]EIT85606.1 Ion transport 2 domain-containing protein [Fictibacillus macauensis ZFHKF-1]